MFKVSSLAGCTFLVRAYLFATFSTAKRNGLAALTQSESLGDVKTSPIQNASCCFRHKTCYEILHHRVELRIRAIVLWVTGFCRTHRTNCFRQKYQHRNGNNKIAILAPCDRFRQYHYRCLQSAFAAPRYF